MKVCLECLLEKDELEFCMHTPKTNFRRPTCKACDRVFNMKVYHARKTNTHKELREDRLILINENRNKLKISKVCPHCKRELPFNSEYFPKDHRKSHGLAFLCYECLANKSAKYRTENYGYWIEYKNEYENRGYVKEKCKINQKTKYDIDPKAQFRSIKSRAKVREFLFEISLDDIIHFWNTPCYYCNGEVNGFGLDRIDSKKGYLADNIAQCCKWCNAGKSTQTQEQYIQRCIKVAQKFNN